jgi:hypothetical protein
MVIQKMRRRELEICIERRKVYWDARTSCISKKLDECRMLSNMGLGWRGYKFTSHHFLSAPRPDCLGAPDPDPGPGP